MKLRILLLPPLFILIGLILSLASKTAYSASEITIKPNENHGQVNQSFGLTVPINNISQYKNELVSLFKGMNVYVKILNPTQTFYDKQEFIDLSNNGFNWYLSSTSYESADQSLAGFFAKSVNSQPVAEIIGYSSFNAQKTTDLKNKYPSAKIHTAGWLFWPREQVRDTLIAVQPPTLEAISFKTQEDTSDTLFGDIHLMFDTMYDASQDIPGGSVKINYPANTTLSLSDIHTAGQSATEIARRAGIISGAIISSVQSQDRGGKAPIRYIIAGDLSSMNDKEKILLRHFANFIFLKPQINWPLAISQNGSIWRSNEPIVGVIGSSNSKFYMFLTNASQSSQNIRIDDPTDFSAYKYFSSTRGEGLFNNLGGKAFALEATETMVIYHPSQYSSPADGPTPTPTNQPTTLTPTTTVPSGSQNMNCLNGTSTLQFKTYLTIQSLEIFQPEDESRFSLTLRNKTNLCSSALIFRLEKSSDGNPNSYILNPPITNLRSGNYDIILYTFGTLKKTIRNIQVAENQILDCSINSPNSCGEFLNSPEDQYLQPGDTNGDNVVNIIDFEYARHNYGRTSEFPGDFNFDKTINMDDINLIKNNFGSHSDFSDTFR